MYGGIDSFPLMAVPFFILASELMTACGLTTALLRFANDLVGHIRERVETNKQRKGIYEITNR